MGKKRANGEGSIFEYPKGSGRWFAQITLPNGKVKPRLGPSQREAREKLKQLQAEQEQGIDLALQQPTLLEWCEIWLERYAKNLKPNIREDYRGVVRRYIASDPIGQRKLHQLTPALVQDWVDRLGMRVAAQTVRNAHARLHTALSVAVKRRYISRNVAEDTDLPQVRTRPIQPLDIDGVWALLDMVAHHRWAVLYRLAVNLGLRQGELLGLTWDAIDLEKGTIRISRQLRRVPGKAGEGKVFALQPTKTAASDRLLDLDEDLIAILKAFRILWLEERVRADGGRRNPWDLLFTSETGAPIHVSMLADHFKASLKAAHLSPIRFHDLRHTAATLMLDDGASLVTVSKILGHSSPAVTARIYAHALDKSKAHAIAGLSRQIRRA
jgi:integrase